MFLEMKLRSAQENEECLMAQVKQLEGQLQQQNQRYLEVERAWKSSTATLTQLQKQDPHDEVNDSTLQGLYRGLILDVSSWAESYCRYGSMRSIDSKEKTLESLSPGYATYLHDETLRPLLLQSLLMRLLVRDVLNTDRDGGLWWAGALSRPLQRIQTELLPSKFASRTAIIWLRNCS